MNDLKFTDLPVEKQETRKDWIKETRAHLCEEHKRWGESLFKTLTLAHTGGIVVVGGLIKSVAELRSSICLRLALTIFVAGLISTLIAIWYEFHGVSKRIHYWDANTLQYTSGETTFGALYEPLRKHCEIGLLDKIIVWTPGILFFAGAACGFFFLWD